MQTLIVVNTNVHQSKESKEEIREKIMKEMKEGLLVVDDSITITSHTITGEIGLEFNLEGDR